MDTTVGRACCRILPEGLPFALVNTELTKKNISRLINACYRMLGLKDTVMFADKLMYTGFAYATRAGVSIGIDDMVIPGEKKAILDEARARGAGDQEQYQSAWSPPASATTRWSTSGRAPTKVAKAMMEASAPRRDQRKGEGRAKSMNSIYMMADSGARGSRRRSASWPACAA